MTSIQTPNEPEKGAAVDHAIGLPSDAPPGGFVPPHLPPGRGRPRIGLLVGGGVLAAVLVAVALLVLGGGNDSSPTVPAATGSAADASSTAVSTMEAAASATVAPTNAVAVVAPATPPPGYVACQTHPDEQARFCLPYYAPLTSRGTMLRPGNTVELTVQYGAPIPAVPEFPLEYRLEVRSSNGTTIAFVLSGGPDGLTCERTVNGSPSALAAGEVCGEMRGPDTLYWLMDVNSLAPSTITYVYSSLEVGADGLRRGDFSESLPYDITPR